MNKPGEDHGNYKYGELTDDEIKSHLIDPDMYNEVMELAVMVREIGLTEYPEKKFVEGN